MKIVILPAARDDLAEGHDFYERQGEGLGTYFLESLFSDVESLRLYAGIHRRVFGCLRLLSKRFPWAIYYEVHGEEIRVKAILDCRRNLGRIRRRLRR